MTDHSQVLDRMDEVEVAYLSGAVAVLLQSAHPLVAAGVASTGKFRELPRLRMKHTADHLQQLLTGGAAQTAKIARQLETRHGQIKGVLREDVGKWKAGTAYSASDPHLTLWVYTTLVVGRVLVYRLLSGPLTPDEEEAFYRSTFVFGEYFGVTEAVRPASYQDLASYYEGMVQELAVGREGRELTQALWTGLGAKAEIVRLLASGLLPENVRNAYELPWDRRHQIQARAYQVLVKNLPDPIRARLRQRYPLWSLRATSAS
jgi:uncharacterized protein (DUF2236 family)